MDQNHSWRLLPVEILTAIFQLVVAERPQQVDSCSFVLVCKAWSYPAKAEFTIENNVHLGEAVKNFRLCIPISQINGADAQRMARVEVLSILTSLLSTYLTNLDRLSERSLYSYTSTLDALLDGRLKKLKILAAPASDCSKDEVANYITRCLLMKDRLGDLLISDNFLFEEKTSMEQLFFNRLCNRLHKFDKLTTLCINRKTGEPISLLEHIIESCKSLNNITFYFTSPDSNSNNTALLNNSSSSSDAMTAFVPAFNIKRLKTHVNLVKDDQLLLYIMHKFPQLQKLFLKLDSAANYSMDHRLLTRFLKYLSDIDNCIVTNIKSDNAIIAKSIGECWKATSTPGSERVEYTYIQNSSGELQAVIDLSRQYQSSIRSTYFTYHASTFLWTYVTDLNNKYGKFIREMKLTFETDNMLYLSSDTLRCIFQCCPNLQRLHFQKHKLGKVRSYSEADFSNRLFLYELYIDNCELYTGLLEHWSLLLPELKYLRLRKTTYHPTETQLTDVNDPSNHPFFQIVMPCTKIGLIVFEEDYLKEVITLKLYALSDGTYYYYQYDPSGDGKVHTISRQDYVNTIDSKRIFICCLTKPDILFK